MKKNVADRDESIRKLKYDRFEWEQVKFKSQVDIHNLLKDYDIQQQECTKANQKILRMRKQRASLKEHTASLQDENTALKELYEQLEKKYRETFDEKRSEYVGMKQRVLSVQHENLELKNELSTVEDAYTQLESELSTVEDAYTQLESELTTVEDENSVLKNELSTSSKKYENLLLMNNNQHEHLVENQHLRSRIDEIETWFDEAWAGFRLEVHT